MCPIQRFLGAAALMLAIAVVPAARAQIVTWPSASPPCNGTLQACLNAQPIGAEIRIDSDLPTNLAPTGVTEVVPRLAQSLVAAPGRRPVFPPGFRIVVEIESHTTPDQGTRLEGLTLREGGRVEIVSVADGPGYPVTRLRRMRFEHSSGLGRSVVVGHARPGSLTVEVEQSEFIALNGGAFIFAGAGGSGAGLALVARYNVMVSAGGSPGSAIDVGCSGASNCLLRAESNRIRGQFLVGAIGLFDDGGAGSRNLQLSASNNVIFGGSTGIGIAATTGEGTVGVRLRHNTLTGLGTAVRVAPRAPLPPTLGAVSGELVGNLIASNATGVSLAPSAAAITNRNNLLHANGANPGFTAGPGTVNADPRFDPSATFRLRADSPAIDAGVIDAITSGFPTLPLDADGHRRLKGPRPDLGAFEYGDDWFGAIATPGNRVDNFFVLDRPSTNGVADARVFATPNVALGGVSNDRPYGVWWNPGAQRMSLFNQDLTTMPLGAGYSVFVPAPQPFLVPADPWPSLDFIRALIPTSSIDLGAAYEGLADWIVIVTQFWNPPASPGVYNNAAITLRYESDRWRIRNIGTDPIPENAAFNLYVQPPSPNAFQLPVGGRSNFVDIDHPVLNGEPCAIVVVTPVFDNAPHELVYAGGPSVGRWRILRSAVSPWPAQAWFNVLVSPRQADECRFGTMFADGFEP
jgi:hypothetical protein